MLRANNKFMQNSAAIADLSLVTLAMLLVSLTDPGYSVDFSRRYFPLLPAAWLAWHFGLRAAGAYSDRKSNQGAFLAKLSVFAIAYTFAQRSILDYVGWYSGDQVLNWQFPLLAVCFIAAGRLFVATVTRELGRLGVDAERVLIVGMDTRATEYARHMREQSPWEQRLHGFVAIEPGPVPPDVYPICGLLPDLKHLLVSNPIDCVVFSIPANRSADLECHLQTCAELGIDAVVLPRLEMPQTARVQAEQIYGLPVVTYTTTPRQVGQLVVKQIMDTLISGAALLALLPAFIIISLAIKVDSQGPIFFRQRRVGLNGRTFFCLKFRTMFADAEQRLEALRGQNDMDGPVFKMKNDPRITRVGRWLRKYSLDELPQLINVFAGDMSLVGPRPPLPAEVAQYEAWHRRRLSVRPGLTCIWQVSGRNNIDFDAWMRLDLAYIDQWSIQLDCKLLLQTIPAVFRGTGM